MTMQVKLVRYTPEPERTVAMSARLCYSPIGAAQLEERISDEQAAKLVRKLVSMGHFSTLEHVTFTFAIEGVSRVLTHQLVRHRIASYSQQSQRYVKEHDFETIVPPSIAKNPEAARAADCRACGPIAPAGRARGGSGGRPVPRGLHKAQRHGNVPTPRATNRKRIPAAARRSGVSAMA